MLAKKAAGAIIFLIGAFLGATTSTNMWDQYPFSVWIVILITALAICSAGVGLWRQSSKVFEER